MEGFKKGWTVGIFQFGGGGITGLIREIKPDHIGDLAAANALYRPGPMKGGVTWDYAKRKHGDVKWESWHSLLDPVLLETYGLIAYQEQVMRISQIIGGFSAAEADDLRKAMGKLYRIKGGSAARDFMKKYEEKWFSGAANRGIERKLADEIWHKILQFGSYGFNKSHSASYALQAYQDMWLKVHYPLEFYAAFLTLESDSDKRMMAIREARTRGYKILPPCVQESAVGWSVDTVDEGIRFGLQGIKDFGPVAAREVVGQRADGYESAEDVEDRCNNQKVNKTRMQALVEAGALDCFGARNDVSGEQIATWEKERLNMSLTVAGGADKYGDLIRKNIYTQDEIAQASKGANVIVGGEVTKIERKQTKKGDPFANVTIVFEMNEWRVKFWAQQLRANEELLVEGNAIMVAGKKDEWMGRHSVVAQQVTDIEALAQELEPV
jgi:DNA polymerase III alpha subunit